MNNYTLYMHTAPNGKKYIGITSKDPVRRWNRGSGYNSNEDFYKDIRKYGWNNFQHKILLSNISREEAEHWEVELIAKYHTMDPKKGYNRNSGGHHHGEVSERTRLKISKNTTPHNRTPCIHMETGREFDSMSAAAKEFGLNRNSINMSCLSDGKRSVKGNHFVYAHKIADEDRRQVMEEALKWDWEW